MALDLLRDSDDNIELEIPVTGDINAPDFSISDIISTVTFKAIKNAVIYNYSPLGMFSLAAGIFDLATALKFDPIEFEYASVELNQGAKEQLDKVAKLMAEKPKVKFLVCAVATVNDWAALNPLKSDKDIVPPVDTQIILDIAEKRQKTVIDYLLNVGQIEGSRLLTCNTKLNKSEASKAIVELSI